MLPMNSHVTGSTTITTFQEMYKEERYRWFIIAVFAKRFHRSLILSRAKVGGAWQAGTWLAITSAITACQIILNSSISFWTRGTGPYYVMGLIWYRYLICINFSYFRFTILWFWRYRPTIQLHIWNISYATCVRACRYDLLFKHFLKK